LLFQVHDERELDRVLKLDGVELIGINNRSLGTVVRQIFFIHHVVSEE
jgi:indole-3-glycerol phosphate synthase